MSQSVVNWGDSSWKFIIIGVGGVGVKAVQHMTNSGLLYVQSFCADTDLRALTVSSVSEKILLGEKLVKGFDTNGDTKAGREVALERINEIRAAIGNADMVFVVAGLGGGTGTGAAPVIAQAAKEMGAFTVGVVTTPLSSEGQERIRTAKAGLVNLKAVVDSLIFIPNDKTKMFSSMYYAVSCLTDVIEQPGLISLDFTDVRTVLSWIGLAFMGTGVASGKNRAREATQQALKPLIDNDCLKNAVGVIYSIKVDQSITVDEFSEIGDLISKALPEDASIIFGCPYEEDRGDELRVTIIAPGNCTTNGKQ